MRSNLLLLNQNYGGAPEPFVYTDLFTSGPLNPVWTLAGSQVPSISSSRLNFPGGAFGGIWLETGVADYEIDLTVIGSAVYIVSRYTNASNCYVMEMQNTGPGAQTCRLFKRVAGVHTQIAAAGTTGNSQSKMRMRCVGTQLTGFSDPAGGGFVQRWQITDATYPTQTKVGIFSDAGSGVWADTFSVTQI